MGGRISGVTPFTRVTPKYKICQIVDLVVFYAWFRYCETISITHDKYFAISLIWATFCAILSLSFRFRGKIAPEHIKWIKMRILWKLTTYTYRKQQNVLNIASIYQQNTDTWEKNATKML